MVSRLEEKGLARRAPVDGSARAQALTLTDQGRALVPQLAALADQNEEHFFGHLAAPQRQTMVQVFRELVAHHQLKDLPLD